MVGQFVTFALEASVCISHIGVKHLGELVALVYRSGVFIQLGKRVDILLPEFQYFLIDKVHLSPA